LGSLLNNPSFLTSQQQANNSHLGFSSSIQPGTGVPFSSINLYNSNFLNYSPQLNTHGYHGSLLQQPCNTKITKNTENHNSPLQQQQHTQIATEQLHLNHNNLLSQFLNANPNFSGISPVVSLQAFSQFTNNKNNQVVGHHTPVSAVPLLGYQQT